MWQQRMHMRRESDACCMAFCFMVWLHMAATVQGLDHVQTDIMFVCFQLRKPFQRTAESGRHIP